MKHAIRIRAVILSAFFALGLLCAVASFADSTYQAGEVLVKFRASLDEAEITLFVTSFGSEIIERDPYLRVYRLRVPAGVIITDMADAMSQDSRVEYAEPNFEGHGGNTLPNDTFFSSQWHILNSGQTEGILDADIDGTEGWELTTGSDSIVIAVLDSGIDFSHPEFQGRLLPGYDFVNDDNDPTADHPHGLYVTGIIAANADNAFSIAGIDRNAKILPVKVLDEDNRGKTSDLADGLVYAANQGADIINLSLIDYPANSRTLQNALEYAREAGAILISSAGNAGIGDADVSGPGASPLTISVGATDHRDLRWASSATGDALDVVAPGIRVPTVAVEKSFDSYTLFSGTSASAPVVSGIASLLLSRNPGLSHEQIELILKTSAEDLVGLVPEDTEGRDDFYGAGRVNLLASLQFAETPPDSTIDSPAEAISVVARGSVEFAGTCTDPLRTDSLAYRWNFEGDSGIEPADTEDPGALVFANPGQVVVSFTCTDGFGRQDPSPATRAITVTNDAPAASITSPAGDITIAQGDSVDFAGKATDPDGHLPLTFRWDFDGARPESLRKNPGSVSFEDLGVFTVSLTVIDDLGAANPTPETRTITVVNEAPDGAIVTPAGNLSIVVGDAIDFSGTGSDPDGHVPLTYLWSFGGGAPLSEVKDPGAVTFSASGIYTVSLVVADSQGVVDPTPDTRVITVTEPDEGVGGGGGGGGGGGSLGWSILLFLFYAAVTRRRLLGL